MYGLLDMPASTARPPAAYSVVAVGLNLGLAACVSMEQVRWLSVVSIVVLALWISKVRFAGHHFERLAGARPPRHRGGAGAPRRTRSYFSLSGGNGLRVAHAGT